MERKAYAAPRLEVQGSVAVQTRGNLGFTLETEGGLPNRL